MPLSDKPQRRLELAPFNEQSLPLFVESIGHNSEQEYIDRPAGFPYYHWLQTAEGEGSVTLEGNTVPLPKHSGVLLFPHVPHTYHSNHGCWQTMYLTFDGPIVAPLLASLHIHQSSFFHWDANLPFSFDHMLTNLETEYDIFGLKASSYAYQLLLTLHKFGQSHNHPALSQNIERLKPLLEWMEQRLSDPQISLADLAQAVNASARQIHNLFRSTFGLSPYAYLVNLRIRKAKELLVSMPGESVKNIAKAVGFRDSSHFIATFRNHTGVPPLQYRALRV